jgi:plasmid stabilization system protein ParE
MTFRIEVTAEAERDADAILEWLVSQHAGETGIRWFLALEDAIQSLAEFPERCPLAPESAVFPFPSATLVLRSPAECVSDFVHY